MKAQISLGTMPFKEANALVHEALYHNDVVELVDVFAQRYLGNAMPAGKRLEIHGVPGNDMACFMDGGDVEVFGNAQDQVGNTMNNGRIVIHGRCGDAAGYAMRGGHVFVRDGCGWRVGINMKQYQDRRPAIVIGGDAGSFLGEYMAGGVIVLMGTPGDYLATGMHGGVIYLKNPLPEKLVPEGLIQHRVEATDEADVAELSGLLNEYNQLFAEELGAPVDASGIGFYALRPASSRPYASMYA